MKTQERYLVGALLIVFCLLIVVVYTARAQSGGGYDLTWNTIDGGLTAATGAGYSLNGTIGQPEVGVELTGGLYSLAGGFWSGVPVYALHLPLISK